MDEIGHGLKAIAALGPLGIALTIALVLAIGAVLSLAIAWKRGFFRSHTDLVRRLRHVARDVDAVRRDVKQLEQDWRQLEGRVDVLAVDQARALPAFQEAQAVTAEIQRTLRRLTSEVARLGGVSSTLQGLMQRGETPPEGRPLGQLAETPDPDRGEQ